jgi:hypothetical protein
MEWTYNNTQIKKTGAIENPLLFFDVRNRIYCHSKAFIIES